MTRHLSMMRRGAPAWLLVLLLVPGGAGAEVVTAVGAAGDAGIAGASGDPPGTGGPGGAGESVSATADAVGESNEAAAVGGPGGTGGAGGDAEGGAVEGGAGGVGGAGGDATAVVVTIGGPAAHAVTQGGSAGELGANGAGADPLPMDVPGSQGGSATASASLDYSGSEAVVVETQAYAGDGGAALGAAPGGAGGSATSTASATATGATGPELLDVFAGSEGGDGQGGAGGDAVSTATGIASGDGAVSVQALARAGGRTPDPGLGPHPVGAAHASAFGESLGAGDVYVEALAWADPFGFDVVSPSVGAVSASAEGHSGTGDVAVGAVVERGQVAGGGVTTELHDAVSGSTAGHLHLGQFLRSNAGDTATSLVATNPGGGSLELEILVGAWTSLPVDGDSADVILGDVIGTSTSGADVSVDVTAEAGAVTGGEGPATVRLEKPAEGGSGAASVPSAIHGASNGGDVEVVGSFSAGDATYIEGGAQPVQGASLELTNAVTGETSGNLWLQQQVSGGDGQDGLPPSGEVRAGGDGGSAHSELAHSGSSESLTLVSRAFGGIGARGDVDAGLATGGTASSAVDAENAAGSVAVVAGAFARGVVGGVGVGADASVFVNARTTGDGHAVRILDRIADPSSGRPSFLNSGAHGGSAGLLRLLEAPPDPIALPGGGDGHSTSIGVAEGDSEVLVQDTARGGSGGSIDVLTGPLATGTSGRGGAAFSNAQAEGGGISTVVATADAVGGQGGMGTEQAGFGGDATADAAARGLGRVESVARARAGAGGHGPIAGQGGIGLATASADGASGFAEAIASTGGLFSIVTPPPAGLRPDPMLGVRARADVASAVDVLASSAVGGGVGPLLGASPFEARAFVVADPFPGAVDPAAGNAALAELLAEEPGAETFAVASFDARASEGAATSEREIALDITLAQEDLGRDLVLAAFDISVLGGDGFEQLAFRLEKAGEAFGDEVLFDSVDALRLYFEDTLIEVGEAVFGGSSAFAVTAFFDLTLGEGDAFGMRVAYATVPEPSTGLLLGFALVAIGLDRRRRAQRR